ncbi:efflux RND transporter permease subunit [Caldilinea sp.]|uniref:efflux RND transporter permease subunit n=1 Tax=Caldilinea sp. TaxID=2293560 RepID=UPI002C70A0A3|nr:efflux RND transporter permease subunit [Caldilinea sp.]
MKLWDISIRQPVFMTMVLIAGVVMGVFSYFRMPVDVYPNIEFPVVVVTTIYPGANPNEVQDQVTKSLEEELVTISGIDTVQSTSSEGLSNIILQFDLDLSADKVSEQVREKVNLLRNRLPTDIQEPIIRRFNPSDQPIMRMGVADKTGLLSPLELRKVTEDAVQAPLQRVANVAAVDVAGGQEREVRVLLDAEAMRARRITPQQVIGAMQTQNLTVPGGSVTSAGQEFNLRTPGNFASLDDIRNVMIVDRGTPVYLHDIATVEDSFKPRASITRLNGQDSVIINVRKQSGSNTVTVVEDIKKELEPILAKNPNLEITIASDQSVQVKSSIDGAIEDLLWGALLASLVVFAFFGDLRSTLVTIAGLPVIMISTLFFMNLMGIGLNNISLLALALVVGLVIDDAIVVRENILRWVHMGRSPKEAASIGTAEVFLPVLATTATVMAVFLPVAYAEGIIGRFFVAFGLTVAIAMAISFFESITMAPMLSAYFISNKPKQQKKPEKEQNYEEGEKITWLDRVYGRILQSVLRHKWVTIVLTLAIFVGSIYSTQFLDFSFVPSIDQHQFDMQVDLPAGTPLEAAEQEALKIEQILRQHPAVTDLFTTIGSTGAPEKLDFFAKLNSDAPSRGVIEQVRAAMANAPGLSFSAGAGIGGAATDISVEVRGLATTSYEALGAEAAQVMKQLETIPGIVDLKSSFKPGRPEIRFIIDRQKAAELGLSTAQIGSTIRTLVNGQVVTTYRGDEDEVDITVQLDGAGSIDDILDLTLLTPAGKQIPLRQIAAPEAATGPNQISRVDRQPTVTISMNVAGRTVAKASTDVTNLVASIQAPEGMIVKMGGNAEAQAEGFQSLGLAMLLSVIFIYMVLASQFNSFVQPLLIMISLPLAIVGALLALFATGRALDLTAFIGFIMLMGLVTKNSILLVDFANRERERGLSVYEAMLKAGPIRLRPILMTSLSLILAMIPLVLGLSAGGEFRQSMSIAIMGGMITSTLLTLLIVPVAYVMVVGWQERWLARRATRRALREARRADEAADADGQDSIATQTGD